MDGGRRRDPCGRLVTSHSSLPGEGGQTEEEEEHGTACQDKKCGKNRSTFPNCHWSHFGAIHFFHPWNTELDHWIDWSGIYCDCDIRILTVKGIYAEGLQQKR